MFEDTEERKKYNEEWNIFFEEHHDLNLEELINKNKINISLYTDCLSKNYDNDLEHTYKEKDDFDCHYSCRNSLRFLFKDGFKWINVKKESKYYQLFLELKTHIKYSPHSYQHFQNNEDLFILKSSKNKLYCISGIAYIPRNINKTFFGYLGELYKETNEQTTIFDFINEE